MSASSQRRISFLLTGLIVVLFGASVLTLRAVERISGSTPPPEVLYIPTPNAARRISLGYTGLMAGIYWTRAVQYFGTKHSQQSMDYHLLYPLLNITTQLDPHLTIAYRFGATFLVMPPPAGAGNPQQAIDLLQYGIAHNPDAWQLYYDMGFIQAMNQHDYLGAARTFEQGSTLPNAHPFLKILAANMAQHGGDRKMARMLWETTLATSEEKSIRKNAEEHLRALQVDEAVSVLEQRIEAYRAATGIEPSSWQQLVSAGYLPGTPLDPLGHPYKLAGDGKVQVQDPKALPFISKGLPPGYQPAQRQFPQN